MTVLLFRGDTFYCTNHVTDAKLLVAITWYSASNGDIYVLTTLTLLNKNKQMNYDKSRTFYVYLQISTCKSIKEVGKKSIGGSCESFCTCL